MAKEVSTEDFDREFELEGNAATATPDAYVGEEDSPNEPSPDDVRMSEPDDAELQRETTELEGLREMDSDNVALYEREMELRKEKEAQAEDDEASDEEASELEAEAEGDEDAEEADEEDEEEVEEEVELEEEEESEGPSSWQEWLDASLPEAEHRQQLFEALSSDDSIRIRYKSNGEVLEESLSSITEKAAGYGGEKAVQEKIQQANKKEQEIQAQAQQVEAFAQRLQEVQDTLSSSLDDPQQFTGYLSQFADLEYMEQLRDSLDEAVGEARSNPQAYQLRKELNEIKQMLSGAGQGGPAHGNAGRPPNQPPSTPTEGSREDFGFTPGQGYPSSESVHVSRAVREMVRDTEVSYDDVVKRWDTEGRKRPIFHVARGLMGSKSRDSRKGQVAEIPPVPKSPKRGRPKKGRKSDRSPSTQSTDLEKPVPWDDIPNRLAAHLDKLKEGAET